MDENISMALLFPNTCPKYGIKVDLHYVLLSIHHYILYAYLCSESSATGVLSEYMTTGHNCV